MSQHTDGSNTIAFTSHDPDSTQQFALRFGQQLQGGEVLALRGDLGAGKTCFVQGLAKGLDVPPEVYVRSPTFALMDEYPGRFPLFHLDLYRLEDEDELEAIGWRDCLDGTSIVAIEWAERIQDALPPDTIDVQFALHPETKGTQQTPQDAEIQSETRTITITLPPRLQHIISAMKADESHQ